MKHMKKIAALLLIICALLSMSGCYNISRELTPEEKNAIEAGTVMDGVYENALFALGFVNPDGWVMSDQQEIYALNEWDAEKDLKEQLIASMKKPGTCYEMISMREDNAAGVNVRIENMAVMDQPDDTEEMYAAAAVIQAKTHFDEIGSQNMLYETAVRDVAGSEHHGYFVTCNAPDGTPMFYKVIYVKRGVYVAAITASSYGEDLTDEILDMFYEV